MVTIIQCLGTVILYTLGAIMGLIIFYRKSKSESENENNQGEMLKSINEPINEPADIEKL